MGNVRRSLLGGALVLTGTGAVLVLMGRDSPTAILALTLAITFAVAYLASGGRPRRS